MKFESPKDEQKSFIKIVKKGKVEEEAYCFDCDWIEAGLAIRNKAKKHAENNHHSVAFRVVNLTIYKKI